MELKISMIVLFLKLGLLFFINVFIGCTGSLLMCALSLVMESGLGGGSFKLRCMASLVEHRLWVCRFNGCGAWA